MAFPALTQDVDPTQAPVDPASAFPFVPALLKLGNEAPPVNFLPQSETILLVDDQSSVRWCVQQMLERLGYRVLAARDGFEALEIADAYWDPIELFVVDVVMPGMSGFAVATELAAAHPEAKLLYLSGYPATRDPLLDQRQPFLMKPFSQDDLAAALSVILDQVDPTEAAQ